jgi:hypothetical protein
MRTPARALCLSQQGNPHGSLPATLRTPSGCSTWHTHWLQPHAHDSIGLAIIHTNSPNILCESKEYSCCNIFSLSEESEDLRKEGAIFSRSFYKTGHYGPTKPAYKTGFFCCRKLGKKSLGGTNIMATKSEPAESSKF